MLTFKQLPIQLKIFITFSLAIFVIIGLICFLFYYTNVKEVKSQTNSLNSILAKQFDKTLELYMKEIEKLSLAIFTDAYIQSNLSNRDKKITIDEFHVKNSMYPRLFHHAYPHSYVENIHIYTNDGVIYDYSKRGFIEIHKQAEEETWSRKLDTLPKEQFLLLPTMKTKSQNGNSDYKLSLVRNIYQIPQRNKIGAMKIEINVNALKEILNTHNHHLQEHMRVLILTKDGAVVYDNQEEHIGTPPGQFDMSIFSKDSTSGNLEWEGNKYIYTYEQSDYTNWNTVVLISNDFMIAEQNRILKYILFIGLFSMLLIAILSYLLSHQITSPLRNMMSTMKKVKQGKLNERMEYTGNFETDLVSRVYNNMLDSINRLISEVYEAKLMEKNAKISALQSQINPHFLYNTLNIMKSISRVKGVEEVAEISESLADLFKYSMKQHKGPVSLREEIAHIQNYMKIQQHRFGDRFSLICNVSDQLLNASIPKLTIQPLIENSIKHGIGHRKGGGIIELSISQISHILVVQVRDNGVGMDDDTLNVIRNKLLTTSTIFKYEDEESGIGLINIQQRIQLLYGERYQLKVDSKENEEVIITMEIPFIPYNGSEGMRAV